MGVHDIKGDILQINQIKSLDVVVIAIENLIRYGISLSPTNDYDLVPKWYVDTNIGNLGVLVVNVADVNGEYDASGDNIRDFPGVTIYDINELQSPAQYDNATKTIKFLNPGETFTARFI